VKWFLLTVVAAVLGACASVPKSPHGEFNGKAFSSDAGTHDLRLMWIDGVLLLDTKNEVAGSSKPVWLEKGRHLLHVQRDRPGEHDLRKLALDVEPCTRYSFVAKDVGSTWEVVGTGVLVIPGCKVQ
jgi:hypothetical protein